MAGPFCIFAISAIFLPLLIPAEELTTSTQLIAFLADLISHSRYSHCALFFIREKDGPVDYNNVKDSFIRDVVTSVSGVPFFNTEFGSETENFVAPEVIYNRRADMCKLVLVLVKDAKSEFFQEIKKTLIPAYLPLVTKDVDPWIWITTKPSQIDSILLCPILPARTKYKLAISVNPSTGNLVIKSVCFFCDSGRPFVVTLPDKRPSQNYDYFPDYVSNLNGHTVRVAFPAVKSRVWADPPYTKVNNANRGIWKGYIEEHLVPKFNCTYNLFMATGKGTGLKLPNGTWIGTVGDIIADRADVGIITAHTPDRIKVVSFTNSFMDISFLNFITSQGTRVFSPAALLWPFDLTMWACLGLSTLVAFIVFRIIRAGMKRINDDDDGSSWTIRRQVMFILTSYLDQDFGENIPQSTPLRCFVALWLFFTIIVTTIYRSKMVGFLAFPFLEQVPETFEQLVKSKYQVGFSKHGDAAYNTLKASTDPVYVKLVRDMEIITGVGLECLERVVTKKYACIMYSVSAIYLQAANLSDSDSRKLVYAPETTYNIYMGFALESGSIFKESFERSMGWTRPFHLPALWEEHDMYYDVRLPKRAWWRDTGQMDKLKHSAGKTDDDLTLKHISGAFYSLVGCLVISGIVFIYEMLYYYRKKQRKKVRSQFKIGNKSTAVDDFGYSNRDGFHY